MKDAFFFFLLILVKTEGGTEIECDAAADRRIVKCKFPENVNSTRTDYAVYFSPESGSQEVLVDCAWLGDNLYCIKQTGVQCEQTVSYSAVIYLPNRYAEKNGTYKCIAHGHVTDNSKPCRFPETQDKEHLPDCKASASWEVEKVVLKCMFSFNVENFCIQDNTNVVASYTKSDCLKSSQCNHTQEQGYDVFTVTLTVSKHANGEFVCKSLDRPSTRLEMKQCSVALDTHDQRNQGSSVTLLAGITSAAGVAVLVSATVVVLFIRRRKNREKSMTKNRKLVSCSNTSEKIALQEHSHV